MVSGGGLEALKKYNNWSSLPLPARATYGLEVLRRQILIKYIHTDSLYLISKYGPSLSCINPLKCEVLKKINFKIGIRRGIRGGFKSFFIFRAVLLLIELEHNADEISEFQNYSANDIS